MNIINAKGLLDYILICKKCSLAGLPWGVFFQLTNCQYILKNRINREIYSLSP